jgi:hypothetical protein
VTRKGGLIALVALLVAAVVLAAVFMTDGHDSSSSGARLIPQPPVSSLNARTRRRLAPSSKRVDLLAPSFTSSSVQITNPLFPISRLRSVILVGRLEGVRWRAETTLLPRIETVAWNGMKVRTRLSQFVAYLDGRIFEVAVDRYAQATDGSVWYLGEDAYTYEHGRVSDREGTWLAGKDGPPAMIMPAHPKVGDVYRTENIPGTVFEQVTIEKVGETLNGPTGPVHGVIVGRELHMDEVRLEEKLFAPGYGEFRSGGGTTYEATALVVPADSVSTRMPTGLESIFRNALDTYRATRAERWRAAATALVRIERAQRAVKSPPRLVAELRDSVDRLRRAVGAHRPRSASGAALDVAGASLDLQLRYRSQREIDSARLRLWALRLSNDRAARDRGALRGDLATMRWIRERVMPS